MKKTALWLLMALLIIMGTGCAKNKVDDNDATTESTDEMVEITIEETSSSSTESETESTEITTEETTESGIQATTEGTTQKPSVKPTQPTTEKPTQPTTEKPTQPTTEKPADKESVLGGDLSAIIQEIYKVSKLELPKTADTSLTEENESYYIGTTDAAYTEALASEPMMSSIAHSVVLLRVEDGADIDKIKEDIKSKVDSRKWICVGVEPENVIVDNIGNLVILIMSENSAALHDAFTSLK